MITLRAAAERGLTKRLWLKSHHSFSFGDYHDPAHMRFGPLRVINDDFIAPGAGFPPHSHSDMEILTYMVEGRLAHEDSMGNRFTIGPGEVQVMSAGTGITHSEMNASESDPVRLLQIWILPEQRGLKPSYDQCVFTAADKTGRLLPIAAGRGAEGALKLHQDAAVHACRLEPDGKVAHEHDRGRRVWIQMITGQLSVNGLTLAAGDGAGIEDEAALIMSSTEGAEFLLFDLP